MRENVCFKCMKPEDECTCVQSHLIEIDSNCIDIVKELNQKGYQTVFSCGGHAEYDHNFTYVAIKNFDIKLGLPKGFSHKYYKDKGFHSIFCYSLKKDYKDYREEMLNQNNALREWAFNLVPWGEDDGAQKN